MRTDHVRRRRAVPVGNLIAGFVALLALVALAMSPFLAAKTISAVGHHEEIAADVAANHFNQVVRDGAMDFVVHSAQCGTSRITGADGQAMSPRDGEFCVVDVTLHNDGTVPVALVAGVQQATGSRGAVYPSDGTVDAVVNGGDPAVIPGGSWDEKLVFDVPPGISLVDVDLHGAAYSRGVVVRL
jgi:hypothetical protein